MLVTFDNQLWVCSNIFMASCASLLPPGSLLAIPVRTQSPAVSEDVSISTLCPSIPPVPVHFSAEAKAPITFLVMTGFPSVNQKALQNVDDHA